MKIYKTVLPLFLCFLLLCGCGNYLEIEDTFLVSGIAVDKGEKNNFSVTVEIAGIESGEQAPSRKQLILSAEGESLYSALGNISAAASRKLFLSQTAVVIIGEEAAKDGLLQIIDLAMRDTELRITNSVVVAKGCKAKELLSAPSAGETIKAYEIKNVIKTSAKNFSVTPDVAVYELINAIGNRGIAATLPAFSLEKSEKMQSLAICGTAVFKDDKLKTFLNTSESKLMTMLMDKTEETTLAEKIDDDIISLKVYKCDTDIKPGFKGEKPVINISVKLDAGIDELTGKDHVLSAGEHEKIRKQLEEKLKKDIEKFIEKLAFETGEDIIGFGSKIYKKYPDEWMKFKHSGYLKDIICRVNVKISFRSTGFVNKAGS